MCVFLLQNFLWLFWLRFIANFNIHLTITTNSIVFHKLLYWIPLNSFIYITLKKNQSFNKKCYCLYLQCLCCWYVKYNFYPPDRTVTYIMRYFTSCWKIPSSSFSHPISYCSEMHAAVCTKYLQLKCPQLFPLLMVNLCYGT